MKRSVVPLAGHGLRPPPLRWRASRPQLKREPLGSSPNMFSHSAELYDLIYSSFKDYSHEAGQIAALLGRIHPQCRTILDVACGTGEHANLLVGQYGFEVDGLDLDEAFVRIAKAKHP